MNSFSRTARAHANIALIKYWGKRHIPLNLPAVGSISLTLEALTTTTTVSFSPNLDGDSLFLNDIRANDKQGKRVFEFLDRIRGLANISHYAAVRSENNFPTGAGLASSASGFAALAVAAAGAARLDLPSTKLSELARLGSGSAARSIFGGFVEMHLGEEEDGSDAIATQIENKDYWPLELLILITSTEHKKIGSTEGMNRTAETSPFYQQWVDTGPKDMRAMKDAISSKDFSYLGELTEYSCLKMHALAMAANPGIIYWNPLTMRLIETVREMRAGGLEAYFTIDAGPQVKVICKPEDSEQLRAKLREIPGIKSILHTRLGGPAKLLDS
ncbi:MAG: diphosphomevalonate decarboxylase [Calditrichia bacterium]